MDLVEVLFKMFCICNPHATDHTVASEPVPEEAIIKQFVPAMQRVLKALLAYKRHLHFCCFLLWALGGRRGDGSCWALSWLRWRQSCVHGLTHGRIGGWDGAEFVTGPS